MSLLNDIRAISKLGKTLSEHIATELGKPDNHPLVVALSGAAFGVLAKNYLDNRVTAHVILTEEDPLRDPPPMDVLPDTGQISNA